MKKLLLALLVLCALPLSLQAVVRVEVDTQGETVNAIEGSLVLPRDVVLEDIYTGDSIILIWLLKPSFNAETHTLSFAGLTPGGFKGKYPIFSFSGAPLSHVKSLEGSTIQAYKNDGQGTPTSIKLRLSEVELAADESAPEAFPLQIARSEELYDGARFLTFQTQDKGSGVARYEYASTWLRKPGENAIWREISSPYLIPTPDLFKRLHVRALDHQGNFRAVSTSGPYWYLTFIFGLIILVCLALCLKRSLSSSS